MARVPKALELRCCEDHQKGLDELSPLDIYLRQTDCLIQFRKRYGTIENRFDNRTDNDLGLIVKMRNRQSAL